MSSSSSGSLLGVALTLGPPALPDLAAAVLLVIAGAGLVSGRLGPLPLVVGGILIGVIRALVLG